MVYINVETDNHKTGARHMFEGKATRPDNFPSKCWLTVTRTQEPSQMQIGYTLSMEQ